MLHLLGLLSPPKSGDIYVEGLGSMTLTTMSSVTSETASMDFVFRSVLVAGIHCHENVAMPLFKIAEVEALEAKVITEEILEMMGYCE